MDTRNRTPIQFYNCRQCTKGQLVSLPLTINTEGTIIPKWPLPPFTTKKDFNHAIISPGFIELQINGALGFHFVHLKDQESYQRGVKTLTRNLPSKGVTCFYPTVPTVAQGVFHDVSPFLKPHDGAGQAAVLGAHVWGPFLAPSKAGAHDRSKMHLPVTTTLETFYSTPNLVDSIRLITLAPELPGALNHIKTLTEEYGIHVSMGHSAATLLQSHRRSNSSPPEGDGIYPGHAQVPFNQVKAGNKVTIEGTETLIGTCIGLDECERNLMEWAGIKLQEAPTPWDWKIVADWRLEVGKKGDFVILEHDGTVKETWVLGEQVFNGVLKWNDSASF
ncbi:N-acetylglucosamine-6-phosphate deacetylase [Lachnellula subtilissima]|uniref:N-acetylglucosamine-6-phosphate deacetylase n=1 Tax=Lachnellula subtilissima TaxID=602034 RepID=A0A8H8RXF1_9HELO|nr:N-acetylglucosamine-6-phosphate deacetylase [Lachnellula subtilissima]